MARKKNLTRTGLPQFLSSTLRTVRLKELAEKRGKRLHILRKFIERISCDDENVDDFNKSKLSIEEFAQKIDLKPGTWSRIERAESCLSIEVAEWIVVKVLKKFGVFVTTEWLLAENDNSDLPRIINREHFDIYSYLKDIYKAEEFSKELNDSQKATIKSIYEELETSNQLILHKELKEILNGIDKSIMSKGEKEIFDKAIKKDLSKPLEQIDCTVVKSVVRRLIVSSDISLKEKSTRLLLANYFMSDLFQKINPDSIITYVRDNKMSPIFFKGEVVGGTLISFKNLKSVDKKECIIEFKNSIKIVRILHYVSNNTLILNTTSSDNSPEIHSLDEIQSIAIVLFRYKNIERDGLNIDFDNDHTPTLIKFEDIRD